MHIIQRFLSMMTIQNIILLHFFNLYPAWFQDVLRGTSVMILIMIVLTWFTVPVLQYYVLLFRSFIPSFSSFSSFSSSSSFSISDNTIIIIQLIADFILHFLPTLVIGLPTNPNSLLIAYGILCVWFSTFGKRISEIYVPGLHAPHSLLWTGIITVCLYLYY